jgi:hypothetical protein
VTRCISAGAYYEIEHLVRKWQACRITLQESDTGVESGPTLHSLVVNIGSDELGMGPALDKALCYKALGATHVKKLFHLAVGSFRKHTRKKSGDQDAL